MSDIKAEQLQKQNAMNKTVIAERQLCIADTPQAEKLWWKVLLHGNSATWGSKQLAARSIFNPARLPALTAEREGFGKAQGGSAHPLERSRT